MKRTIEIDYPPELLVGLHLNVEDMAEYIKRQAAINLFKEGRLSFGTIVVIIQPKLPECPIMLRLTAACVQGITR